MRKRQPESDRLLPQWVGLFFIAAAVVLIPWIVLLMTATPHEFGIAKHWKLVWVGFDCFLVLGFAVTAYRVATHSPRGAITAACTGTMLLIDAWFDILTSRRPTDQLTAVLMALFAEIPCALICFYVSRRIVGMFEQAAPYIHAAGFRIVGGKLVPPASTVEGDAAGPAPELLGAFGPVPLGSPLARNAAAITSGHIAAPESLSDAISDVLPEVLPDDLPDDLSDVLSDVLSEPQSQSQSEPGSPLRPEPPLPAPLEPAALSRPAERGGA